MAVFRYLLRPSVRANRSPAVVRPVDCVATVASNYWQVATGFTWDGVPLIRAAEAHRRVAARAVRAN